MRVIAAALVAALALLAAVGCGGSSSGSSPERTVYSFVHALKHRNYGRACSYIEQKERAGPVAQCAAGLFANAAMGELMFGIEVFGDLYVVPGSKVVVDDNTVTYIIRDHDPDGIPRTLVEVERQANGKWRIVNIGEKPPKPDAK